MRISMIPTFAAALIATFLRLGTAGFVWPTVEPKDLDVFVPVHNANCVVAKMVEHLNIYLGPRRILIATAQENCPIVEEYADNVRCLDEDQVLAGNVTKRRIADAIDQMRHDRVADLQFGYGGHSTAGWYLQQFLKLGIVDSPLLLDEPLSKVFLVWDSDMILLNPFELYDSQGRIPLMAGGKKHTFSLLQMDQEVEQGSELGDSCNYHVVFQRLTGMNTVVAPGNRGYVPHHMVMRTKHVREMLDEFGGRPGWVWEVLKASCGMGSDFAFCQCGFSEYYSMASWLKRMHPNAVFDQEANYTRYTSKRCCPSQRHFQRNADKLFMGFEQGHCDSQDFDSSETSLVQKHSAFRR